MVSSIGSSTGGLNAAALKKMQEEMFKAVDSNSDNKIDKTEMSAYQQTQQANGGQGGPSVDDIFKNLDADNDSAISRLESDAGIAKLAQQMQSGKTASGPSSELKSKVFNSADQNGDGSISKDELTTLMADSNQSATDIAETFDALDTNQDGSISKSESDVAVDKASQQRKAQGPPPPPPPSDSSSSESTSSTTVFDELDTNEDGTVSASELLAAFTNDDSSSSDSSSVDSSAVKELFDAMDTNKDGSVSKSELSAALAEAGKQSDTQGGVDGSSASSSADAAKTEDSARFAAAIKSYMQASMSSFAQSSAAATFSSSAVYG